MATNGRKPKTAAAALTREQVISELASMEQAAAVLLGDSGRLSPTTAAAFNQSRTRVLARLSRVRPAASRFGIPIPRLVVTLATMAPAGSAESEAEAELESVLRHVDRLME